jgi:cytochrome P450
MLPDSRPRWRPQRGELPPTALLPSLIQTAACRLRPLEYLEWCRHRLGQRFTVTPVDMPPLVFLSELADIRAIVAAPLTVLHSGLGAAVTRPLFGETSFMLLEEDERMRGREAIMPAFHQRAVAQHADMVTDLSRREVASWPLDTPMPLHPRLCLLALTVMLRTVFGEDDPAVEELRDGMLSMLSVAASLVLQEPRLRWLPGWRRTWSRFVNDRDNVDRLIAGIIARRRPAHRHGDMLDMLLHAPRLDGSPMTDTELRDNLVAVIIAGYETTASALAWALQLLAHHPRIQDRLADEADNEDYLEATVNEVLRHRPVFLFSAPRAVVKPIEIGGWTYNPPAHLLGCIYLMHHDPALFPEPHEFRPERFLDSRAATRTWLPWGGGRQRCPGRHLALLELRTVLRVVLSMLRVEPASSKIERAQWRSVIVTPHAGCTVVLRNRPIADPRPAGSCGDAGRHEVFFRRNCSFLNTKSQP